MIHHWCISFSRPLIQGWRSRYPVMSDVAVSTKKVRHFALNGINQNADVMNIAFIASTQLSRTNGQV